LSHRFCGTTLAGTTTKRRAAGDDAGEEGGILDGARHYADRIEAVGQGLDPGALDQIWDYRKVVAQETKAAAAAPQQPKPSNAPPRPPPNYGSGPIQDIITKAFSPYGPTAVAWGLRVAHCESGFNPQAYNPAGPYYGLFQFLMGTFKATPYGSGDIYDPVANANAAAWKWAHGGASAWGCK
jgi:soluble lytic murein transglycosylase-like protein